MLEKLKKDERLKSWLVMDLAISFMLCIFATVDSFYANKDEFWFTIWQMLSVSIVPFLILLIILCGLSIILKKSKASDYIFAFFIGIFLYLYIQGNYIPRNYGVLNGTDIDWNSYKGYAMASIVVGSICIALCFFILVKYRQHVYKVGKTAAVFVILIQCVTIATLMVQNGFPNDDDIMISTDKDYFNLSSDRNVVVFLLDTYEGDDLQYLIEKDNENQSEIFENFTFYRDTLGAYPTTKCALPYILTGVWYQNEQPYANYIKEAYKDNRIYQELKKNKFAIDMYTDSMFLDNQSWYENVEIGSYSIANRLEFAKRLYSLVAFNYMPHQLKNLFFIDTGVFNELRHSNVDFSVFSSNVVNVSNQFDTEGITISKVGNVFKFYHLDGVHGPHTFNNDLKEDNKEYSLYDEASGNNEFLKKYFKAMKDKGIYDSSTIVIMADHGHTQYSQNPIFLIKNVDEEHEFTVSDVEMSWEYLSNIWIALANGEKVDENFIKECNSEYGQRRYLYYTWNNDWLRDYMPGMEEMFCNGKAYETESLILSEKKYLAEREEHDYNLGKILEFSDSGNAYSYCLYGISSGNINQKALMKFDIEEKFENLVVTIKLGENCGIGNVTIYANDNAVAELSYGISGSDLSFIIPKEYVKNKTLELSFDQAKYDSKDAVYIETPLDIDKMTITSTNKAFDIDSQKTACKYNLGEKLEFTAENNNGAAYLKCGFSDVEDWGTWTSGKEAVLRFCVGNTNKDLEMQLQYNTFDGEQNVEVYINDEKLTSFVANGSETREILIPSSYFENGDIDVLFKMPDAHSPASLDKDNSDTRELALGFKSICIIEK